MEGRGDGGVAVAAVNNNQTNVSIGVGREVGEEMRLGRIVGGGGLLTTKKKQKRIRRGIKPPLTDTTTNQRLPPPTDLPPPPLLRCCGHRGLLCGRGHHRGRRRDCCHLGSKHSLVVLAWLGGLGATRLARHGSVKPKKILVVWSCRVHPTIFLAG